MVIVCKESEIILKNWYFDEIKYRINNQIWIFWKIKGLAIIEKLGPYSKIDKIFACS